MLNKTIIQGRMVRTPELRQTPSGKEVTSFTVAWSEKYKETERKLFMPCVAWGALASFVTGYFDKGAEMVVEGYLTSRSWEDKNGNKRETIELNVDRVHFCGSKKSNENDEPTEDTDLFANVPPIENDDDLPF